MLALGLSLAPSTVLLRRPSGSSGGTPFGGALDDHTTGLAAARGLRRVLGDYSGPLIQVRRDSDQALADIGFDADGNLDEAALLAHTGAASGFVAKVYDQTAQGYDWLSAANNRQLRIVNAGSVEKIGSRPAARFMTNETRSGYYTAVNATTYGGPTLTAMAVVSISAGGTDNRVLSVTADNLWDVGPGTACIIQDSGANSINAWRNAQGGYLGSAPLTYGTLTATGARLTGTQHIAYTASAGTPVSSSGNLAVNQHLMSCREWNIAAERGLYNNSRWCEDFLWHADIGAPALQSIQANQRSYWGAT